MSSALEALLGRFPGHSHHPRYVPARPGQIAYEPGGEGVSDLDYDDRNGFRGGNGGAGSRRVCGYDEANVEMQQFLSEAAESIELSVREPGFDDDISSVFPAEVAEPLPK